jgi:hypothetical protein
MLASIVPSPPSPGQGEQRSVGAPARAAPGPALRIVVPSGSHRGSITRSVTSAGASGCQDIVASGEM